MQTKELVVFSVSFGNGDGSFNPPSIYSNGIPSLTAELADVDGDGNTDVIVGTEDGGSGFALVEVYLGNSDGSFQAGVSHSAIPGRVDSIALADFNNDGNLDVVAAGEATPDFGVLLGNGDGSFSSALTAALQIPTFSGADNVGTADFDGDGNVDLAIASGGGIELALGDGTGSFASVSSADGTFQAGQTYSVSFGRGALSSSDCRFRQ